MDNAILSFKNKQTNKILCIYFNTSIANKKKLYTIVSISKAAIHRGVNAFITWIAHKYESLYGNCMQPPKLLFKEKEGMNYVWIWHNDRTAQEKP